MPEQPRVAARIRRVLRRASVRQRRKPIRRLPRLASFLVVVLAGAMMAASARLSGGSDLRPARNQDLAGLVRQQAQENKALQEKAAGLRGDVGRLSGSSTSEGVSQSAVDEQAALAGLTPVKGPAVKVTLTDAPLNVQPIGVDEDLLVVHQQDIQMVVNVLWAGGAEAMTIQGQRVTSLTGIKCVGNTVVLHGVPYAPPYEIVAIGDPAKLKAAIDTSHEVAVYKQYVAAYHLGWKFESPGVVTLPGYSGTLGLAGAQIPR